MTNKCVVCGQMGKSGDCLPFHRTKKLYTPQQLLLLYKAQIRPSLEYCSHVWSSAPQQTLGLLDSIQRRAIRLIGYHQELTNNLDSLEHRRQKLLPLHPPLFSPEFLLCNETGTLLTVAGPNGILVLQLPPRCPPYGAFDNNKEVVYCRSYSLDERLLSCSDVVEVRQVKFHPGSVSDSHILVLTSDNTLRLYKIEKNEALILEVYHIGEKPGGLFPGSKTTFLDIYGEIAVDFDFGFPEISSEKGLVDGFEDLKVAKKEKENALIKIETLKSKSAERIVPKSLEKTKNEKNKFDELIWPVYILRGDFSVFSINIDLCKRTTPALKGPYPISGHNIFENDACSIICLKTTPQIVCIATSTGTLTNAILLNNDEEVQERIKRNSKSISDFPNKELLVFETIELELGLTIVRETDEDSKKYKCPIFLHKDESKVSRFFATHNAGVHSVNISCVEELHNYVFGSDDVTPSSDIFINPSSAEYLVCTKTSNSEKTNPVVGFSLYYEPTSIISLLSDSSVVTLGILTAAIAPKNENFLLVEGGVDGEVQSPLKKMLNEPFDQYIQKILKKASSQPVLKLSSTSNNTPEECYELLQRASQTFREEHFKHFTKAREELEKRVHTLSMLKRTQKVEIEKMNECREELRERAENLAEKYEDTKDKQDELLKRCEQLLMMVSTKKSEPSDAEKKFVQDMQMYSEKYGAYQNSIDKLKKKFKYQQLQIENWKSQETKKIGSLSEIQSNTIKSSLQESTQKINEMLKQVNEYKTLFNLK